MKKLQTLNKGEWSEFYVLLKLLIDQKIQGGDTDLNIIPAKNWLVNYIRHTTQNQQSLIFSWINHQNISAKTNDKEVTFTTDDVAIIAQKIIDEIKSNTNKTFSIPDILEFINLIFCPNFKQNNLDKADITLFINDLNMSSERGFSIKSNLAGSPSLVNASQLTNFIFNCHNLKDINLNQTPKNLVKSIGIENLTFDRVNSEIYQQNLELVDSQLPTMLSYLILHYYNRQGKYLLELLEILKNENPLNLTNTETYAVKIGEFLIATAFGMIPKTPWNQRYSADGGMIIVRDDAELITFYILDQDSKFHLRDYLLKNSFLDTASITRHQFGKIYQENQKDKLKLNLLIRLN